jgi:hypothetical protein
MSPRGIRTPPGSNERDGLRERLRFALTHDALDAQLQEGKSLRVAQVVDQNDDTGARMLRPNGGHHLFSHRAGTEGIEHKDSGTRHPDIFHIGEQPHFEVVKPATHARALRQPPQLG